MVALTKNVLTPL